MVLMTVCFKHYFIIDSIQHNLDDCYDEGELYICNDVSYGEWILCDMSTTHVYV